MYAGNNDTHTSRMVDKCVAAAGDAVEEVEHDIKVYSGGKITQYWIGQWSATKTQGTTVFLFGLRNDRTKHGWGLDFDSDKHDLQIDREAADGNILRYDLNPLGRTAGHLPSTDWSLRQFLAGMFLCEGTCCTASFCSGLLQILPRCHQHAKQEQERERERSKTGGRHHTVGLSEG